MRRYQCNVGYVGCKLRIFELNSKFVYYICGVISGSFVGMGLSGNQRGLERINADIRVESTTSDQHSLTSLQISSKAGLHTLVLQGGLQPA